MTAHDRYYQLGSHDKLFNQIDELTDALASRDAEIATLREQVRMLRDALEVAQGYSMLIKDAAFIKEALTATKEIPE